MMDAEIQSTEAHHCVATRIFSILHIMHVTCANNLFIYVNIFVLLL